MTYLKDVFGKDLFAGFDKVWVGFDDQFAKLSKVHEDLAKSIPNYPPYNIKKTGDNTYVIEMAVAGFGEQNIEMTLDGDKLIVKGSIDSEGADENFLFKGIANRAFTRTFALDDQIEIQNAEMLNGMLQIFLERIVPESKKPRKIEVKSKSKKTEPQYLTEDNL